MLSRAAIPQLKKHGIHFADRVFGLRDTGRMTTAVIARLLADLPEGVSELYFHPGAEPAEPDYAALAKLARRWREPITPSPRHPVTLLPPPAAH